MKAFHRLIGEEYSAYLEDVKIGKRTQHTTGRTVSKIVGQLCNQRATYGATVSIEEKYRLDLDTAWMEIENKLLQNSFKDEKYFNIKKMQSIKLVSINEHK